MDIYIRKFVQFYIFNSIEPVGKLFIIIHQIQHNIAKS